MTRLQLWKSKQSLNVPNDMANVLLLGAIENLDQGQKSEGASSNTRGKRHVLKGKLPVVVIVVDRLISHGIANPLSCFKSTLVVRCQPAAFANASPLPRKSHWRPRERSPKSRLHPFRLVTLGSARRGPRRPAPHPCAEFDSYRSCFALHGHS